jgi:hypothetical protein
LPIDTLEIKTMPEKFLHQNDEGSGPVGIFIPLIGDFEPGSEAFPSYEELPEASVISKLHHRPAKIAMLDFLLNFAPHLK